MSMSFTKELRLSLKLMLDGKRVPIKLKEKAIEQIKVMSMGFEEGDAEQVLLDMLLEALEKEDAELLRKSAMLVGDVFPDIGQKVDMKAKEEFLERLSNISLEACRRFVDEKDSGARGAIVEQLAKVDMVPVYYDDGFMLIYSIDKLCFVAASVNGVYRSRDFLVDRLESIPHEELAEITDLLHRITEEVSAEVRFVKLDYNIYANNQVMLKMEEFNGTE